MTVLWYTARGTGVVALLLLTATVALGAAGTARVETSRWPRVVTAQLHRHLSLLVVAFVAVHIASTVLDPFAPVGWAAAVVPFSSAYRPVWLGLGAVALDLLLAVLVTSLLRARLGYRTWRAVHWLAYASWPVALWHGLGAGTDSRLTPVLGLDVACVAVVACALWLRLGLLPHVGRRIAVGAGAVAVALATTVFAVGGPLQPGWARRAGTPVALLSGAVSAAVPAGTGAAGLAIPRPAGGSFTGQLTRSGLRNGQTAITIRGWSGRSPRQSVTIRLHGRADGTGVSLTSGDISIRPHGSAQSYRGPVTRLNGGVVSARLRGAGGYTGQARITMDIRGARVTGVLAITGTGA